ncbi:acyl-CoA dehydrogenase family protein [Novosphingobium tardum]|uniref:Acyl-CoA dehydrogenase family protein n=1 Tax=Novosphingobium tardum TaxID=1538021 RepID=A0ABV8RSZ3_9SPHN
MSAGDRAFRDEVRAFLDAELTPELRRATRRSTSVFVHPDVSLAWQAILERRGWVAPEWPVEYGGTGWSEIQRYIFADECARANAPSLAPMGLKMVAPVIMHYGTEEQRATLLPRILSGADYWCQGYSEPGSGSDLASLRMRAERDGDHYVVNGSKIWTTHAHFANRMFCLVRTSNEGRPQTGITFLLVDMTDQGITVAPITTLAGEHEFNQVFFDDVRVPVGERLGEENDGWTVAKHLLTFERSGRASPGLHAHLAMLEEAAAKSGWLARPGNRERLAREAISADGLRAIELAGLADDGGMGAMIRPSMLKVLGTEASQRIDLLALEIATDFAPGEDETMDAAMPRYLNNRASTIYGGSNEIQRDIMARAIVDAGA